jgi:hypothetical protein
MFKISNTQKAVLDFAMDEERIDVVIQCNPASNINTVDWELADSTKMKTALPRVIKHADEAVPVSNVEFTLEITSLDGEVKRISGVADVTNHLQKSKNVIKLGAPLLKELNACIVM